GGGPGPAEHRAPVREPHRELRRLRRHVVPDLRREVVGVDEHLRYARPRELREPAAEQRAPGDREQALRRRARDLPHPRPEARGQEHRLHPETSRTTPRSRIRASARAITSSTPASSPSHSRYSATESSAVRRGSQPSERSCETSDTMCRVSPKRYVPLGRSATSRP